VPARDALPLLDPAGGKSISTAQVQEAMQVAELRQRVAAWYFICAADAEATIELQKMNWKFGPSFQKQTGVSLNEQFHQTHQENTPVSIRIPLSHAPVKDPPNRLQHA